VSALHDEVCPPSRPAAQELLQVTASPAPTPPARRLHGRKEERRAALPLINHTAAVLWRDRAEIEQRASGETLRRAESTPLYRLTPQELQIARFVATGATTKAVAAQLFLSPRTVDAHLRNIFRKLGVTSRAQLVGLSLGAHVDGILDV
jgi:DNA-binding CsgD family transcriptional regulator